MTPAEFERHWRDASRMVEAMARRWCWDSEADREDIVATTAAIAWERRETWVSGAFSSWCVSITRNLARKRLRDRRAGVELDGLGERARERILPVAPPPPLPGAERGLLDCLPCCMAAVVRLKAEAGLSLAGAAVELGVTRAEAARLWRAARPLLAAELARRATEAAGDE